LKIYTKSGDDGQTGILGQGRLFKDDLRIEAYGTIDELNAALGVARALSLDAAADDLVGRLQAELFLLGSALADPDPAGPFHSRINADHVAALEQIIDSLDSEIPRLTQFILPGGTPSAAQLHLARTICRRAERRVVALARQPDEHVPSALLVYLNRLSDLLFVLARVVNHRHGADEIVWKGL
jgi:cob(I)alamin adenosyltransferase